MSRSRERLGEPSRPAIMGSSSFTGRRWAATGRCLKKIRLPKQKRLPQALSHAEVQRILGNVRNPIHKACFALIYACGLRISEAATLEVTAIDKVNRLLGILGKGDKERLVPLPRPVHDGLREMWKAHRNPRWLFPNSWGTGPLSTNVLVRTFADAAQAADLPGQRGQGGPSSGSLITTCSSSCPTSITPRLLAMPDTR